MEQDSQYGSNASIRRAGDDLAATAAASSALFQQVLYYIRTCISWGSSIDEDGVMGRYDDCQDGGD
jgi:hypothetical protein